jgi:hypothetical protein
MAKQQKGRFTVRNLGDDEDSDHENEITKMEAQPESQL